MNFRGTSLTGFKIEELELLTLQEDVITCGPLGYHK
jgi:hypothetical protein